MAKRRLVHEPTSYGFVQNGLYVPAVLFDSSYTQAEVEQPYPPVGTGKYDYGYIIAYGDDDLLRFKVHAHQFYIPEGQLIHERINYKTTLTADLVHEFYHRKRGKKYGGYDANWKALASHEGTFGRFLKIENIPVEFKFSSSDPEIMTVTRVSDIQDKITIRKIGTVRLILTIGDTEVARIPFEIHPSPVRVGMTEEERLKTIGFPSSEAKDTAAWPSGRTLNRVYAEPTAEQGFIDLHHLRYDKYPELVISVDHQGRVKSFHSNTIHVRNR